MAYKEARPNTSKPSGKMYKSVKPIHTPNKGKYELPRNGPQKKGNR